MDKYSIKNTTREERLRIVTDSLNCGGGGCEACSGCGVFGGIDPDDMYQPYIDGLMEISEINNSFRTPFNIKGR